MTTTPISRPSWGEPRAPRQGRLPPSLPPSGGGRLRAPTSHVLDGAVQHQVEQRVEAFQDAAGCGERKGDMPGTLRATAGRPSHRQPRPPPLTFPAALELHADGLVDVLGEVQDALLLLLLLVLRAEQKDVKPRRHPEGRKAAPSPATPTPSDQPLTAILLSPGFPRPGPSWRHFRPRPSRDRPLASSPISGGERGHVTGGRLRGPPRLPGLSREPPRADPRSSPAPRLERGFPGRPATVSGSPLPEASPGGRSGREEAKLPGRPGRNFRGC